jgi:hypothetical protein
MKKNLIRLFVFFVVFAFIASSCNKENDEQAQNIPDNIATATVDEAVRLAKQKYLVAEVFEGDEHQSFFIPNEGLIDEYLAGEENTMPDAKMPSNTFIRCLSSLGLSDAQIPLVRRALLAHENRNEMLIERHRQELETILARAEAQRSKLLRQLMAGEISRPEFNRKIALLRTNLQNALLRLKETNADAFSRSYRMLMNHLHNILEPRQWNVFTDCLK